MICQRFVAQRPGAALLLRQVVATKAPTGRRTPNQDDRIVELPKRGYERARDGMKPRGVRPGISTKNDSEPAERAAAHTTKQLFEKRSTPGITNLTFCGFVNGCRPLRGLRFCFGFDPGVCSLRSLHPRLYAAARFAGW